MRDNKKTIIVSIGILVIALLGFLAYKGWSNSHMIVGQKNITVTVVSEQNKYKKDYKHKTKAETLGAALDELGIIGTQEGEFGRWLDTVDNIKADASKKEWWRIQVNGKDSQTGLDQTPIKDNDAVELRLMLGW